MRTNNFAFGLITVSIVVLTAFGMTTRAFAQQELVLHSFSDNNTDGFTPYTSLLSDSAGNLYGTTSYGGAFVQGTVFELIRKAGGGWTERLLHSFNSNLADGFYPRAGLTFDSSGNIYGTTYNGGTYGYGTVFELMHTNAGGWIELILYSFNFAAKDAFNPDANLVFDAAGNLYGTTEFGGAYNFGTVFALTPGVNGEWTERILHNFNSNLADGYEPLGGLTLVAGHLYGTTHYGGAYGGGAVFELIPHAGGAWTEKIVHSFNKDGVDGLIPSAGLISDSSGNLFGTTLLGGNGQNCSDDACGTAFELSPKANGTWTETILYNFTNNGIDGFNPYAGLILSKTGNLYGVTAYGGGTGCGSGGCGTAFELMRETGGTWTERLLHTFGLISNDGTTPFVGMIIDPSGNLYGSTPGGGQYGFGTVFEIKP